MVNRINAECLERGQDDQNGGPAVVEREGKVDEDLVRVGLGRVMLLDDIVDVCDCGTDE